MENLNNKENIKEEENDQLELTPEYKLSEKEIREALKESPLDFSDEEIEERVKELKNRNRR